MQAIRSFSSKRPRWSNSDCRDAGRRCSSDTGVHRLAIDAEHGVDSTEGERIRLGEPQGNVDSGAAPLTKCRRCDLGGQQRGQRITIGRYDLRQSTAERFSPTRLQFHHLATALSSNISHFSLPRRFESLLVILLPVGQAVQVTHCLVSLALHLSRRVLVQLVMSLCPTKAKYGAASSPSSQIL